MGDEVGTSAFSREQRQRYRRKVQLCLDVFERMLGSWTFDSERPLTGLEVELNLVDAGYQPFFGNLAVLEEIADPAFQTELGAFNIEFNVPPRPLGGQGALSWRRPCGRRSTRPRSRRTGAAVTSSWSGSCPRSCPSPSSAAGG
jgi:hypothetical protein